MSQLRTCYGKHDKNWNCDEWLRKTPNVCCLPEKKGYPTPTKCRKIKKNERIVGKLQIGPRGGRFFMITEKDGNKKICDVKVYV